MAGLILTQKSVKVGGIALLAVVAITGGYFIGSPIIEQYASNADEYSSAQTQLDFQKTSLASLEASKTNFDNIKSIDEGLKQQFPEMAGTEEFLDVLVRGLNQAGLSETSLKSAAFKAPEKHQVTAPGAGVVTNPTDIPPGDTPGVEEPAPAKTADPKPEGDAAASNPDTKIDVSPTSGEYATIEVALNIEGSSRQLQQFLDYINKVDRAYLINTFSIQAKDDKSTLSVTGKIFVYPSIKTPEELAKNPEADPTNNTPDTGDTTGTAPKG